MAITHSIQYKLSIGSNVIQKTVQISSEGEINIDVQIPADTANVEIAFAVALADLKSLFMNTDRDVLVETNDGTTPADSFTLEVDKPFVWNTELPVSSEATNVPFSADITALFLSNAHATLPANVQIRTLVDATP